MTKENNISKEITAELKGLSPTLASVKKENIFDVPNGYFEQLPAKIIEQCREEDLYKSHGIMRYLNVKSIAAAASVILIAISLLVYNIKDSTHQLALQDLTDEEVLGYLDTHDIYDINEEELIEEFSDSDNLFVIGAVLETDEIIDYLMENNIDLTAIINEIN